MNIEMTDLDMILNYLETTSLEPHDDYTSVFTYKEQKILYKYIKQLQQENKHLKERINYLERNNNRREDTILEQRQRISNLEDNWNKLKKHCNIMLSIFEKMDEQTKEEQLDKYAIYGRFLYKMQELERSDNQ